MFFTQKANNLALFAQNKLLHHFIKNKFEVLEANSLNYVVVYNKDYSLDRQFGKKNDRTLVLMHGFGLGLGFFFGKYVYFLFIYGSLINLINFESKKTMIVLLVIMTR